MFVNVCLCIFNAFSFCAYFDTFTSSKTSENGAPPKTHIVFDWTAMWINLKKSLCQRHFKSRNFGPAMKWKALNNDADAPGRWEIFTELALKKLDTLWL